MCSSFTSMFSFSCAKVINESIKEDLLQGPKLEEDLIRCAECFEDKQGMQHKSCQAA